MKKFMWIMLVGAGTLVAEVEPIVPAKVEYFPLSAVRLTTGPLAKQQDANRRYLLQLEPDRMLSHFRSEAGLEPKAAPYRGWESEGALPLCGHILGFYMSGAAMTYASTGDEEIRRRLIYIVDELAEVQRANGDGFALANPTGRKLFTDIAAGHIKTTGGHAKYTSVVNNVFAPVYTMNKVLLGLEEIHRATGYAKAKQVFLALTDWFGEAVVEKLSDAQLQALLFCEHGSLPETFADAYLFTGDEKYRTWARRLCHRRMLEPLAKGDGAFFTGCHANDSIPKYTAYERVYRITGDETFHRAAINAWDEIVNRRSWVNGGNSANEHFHDREDFLHAMEVVGPETCNSVNMLRQTEAVFATDPDPKRIDFYERNLFNHLLAAHDDWGMTCYYTPMRPNSYRFYSDPFDAMWCCTGTGLEVPGKYGRFIYTHAPDNSAVAVQLFAPSTLDWTARGVKLEQRTGFPYEAGTTIVVTEAPAAGAEFTLKVRHPSWVDAKGFVLALNGQPFNHDSRPGSMAGVKRAWKCGDTLKVSLPMTLRVESLPGSVKGTEAFAAYIYGPIVLVGELGRQGLTKYDFWSHRNNRARPLSEREMAPQPVADGNAELLKLVEPIPNEPLHFRSRGFWPRDVKLAPFFEVHYQRYSVYWERVTSAEAAKMAAARSKRAELDARTVDFVEFHNAESERAHELKGVHLGSGRGVYGKRLDQTWRDATNGGWFSFKLKCEGARTLHFNSYGMERGARTFDVLVEGKTIKTESLVNVGVDDLVDHDIPLPPELLQGKQKITIMFKAHPGNTAGGFCDLRLLK